MWTNLKGKERNQVFDTIYEEIDEESKQKITGESRKFIQAENKEAVKIGDLEKYKETGRVAKPQLGLETYPNARVREGADELTLRAEEKLFALAFSSTQEINCDTWEARAPADEDQHALC